MNRRPIIILGAARSGTTLLSRLMSEHPDVLYINEPKMIWGYKNNFNADDVLGAADASEDICRFIKNHFASKMAGRTESRFMEKTPANCLRLPFILSVYPDAQIVHVLRDGRDVAISARSKWLATNTAGSPTAASNYEGMKNKSIRRLRNRLVDSGIPLRDLIPYLFSALRNMLYLRHAGRYYTWGPRIPSLKALLKQKDLLEVCGLQWEYSVRAVQEAARDLDQGQYMELRYENLVENPEQELTQILEFLELDVNETVIENALTKAKRQNASLWKKRLDDNEIAMLDQAIGGTLRQLGYP